MLSLLVRSLVIGAGLALAGTTAASAAPVQATTAVNVRAQPSGTAAVTGGLAAGQVVEATQCTAGWCHIQAPEGWVSARYLVAVGTAPAQKPKVQVNLGNGGLSINLGNGGITLGGGQQGGEPQPAPPSEPAPMPDEPAPPPNNPAPPPAEQQAQAAQACFYSERNYAGQQLCLPPGSAVASLTPPFTMQSAKLPGVSVIIYSQPNFGGGGVGMGNPASNYEPYVISSVKVTAN